MILLRENLTGHPVLAGRERKLARITLAAEYQISA
jgi:hypothetical protein